MRPFSFRTFDLHLEDGFMRNYIDIFFMILLRARRNEKEMKVTPAISFKLLTNFIHKK